MPNVARYTVMHGCTGCIPNFNEPYAWLTRREMLSEINGLLDYFQMPRSLLRKETRGIREIWRFVAKRGSSSAHFSVHHKGMALEFVGLTKDEYDRAVDETNAEHGHPW